MLWNLQRATTRESMHLNETSCLMQRRSCVPQLRPHSTKYINKYFFKNHLQFSSIQSLSHVRLFATPWTAARQDSLSITNSQSLLKLMSIESVMPSNHLIFFHPLLLPLSIFPSIRVFSNESVLHIRWPKYWSFSFSFSISPSNEHSGLISFRMDWLDLLAVQGTLKSLLQHHCSKASILWHSAFFTVQLSHPYMTTGKTIALTRRTFDLLNVQNTEKLKNVYKSVYQPKQMWVNIWIKQRRQWHPTPVLLPGKSHGWRSLVG